MTADNKTSRHRISAVLILISIVAVLGIALAGEQMMPVAGAIVLAGFGLAAANWTRVLLANGGAVRGVSNERFGSKSRLTLLMMLHALLWVAVIFLADTIWGDVVSQWLVLPFVLINGLLAVLYQRRFKRQD